MSETDAVLSRWHTPTLLFLWAVALAFAGLSCYINDQYAVTFGANQMFHAAIPVVVLVAALMVELMMLSEAHGWARWIAVAVTFFVFVVALCVSYLAVEQMALFWSHLFPTWLLKTAAVIPDAMAVAAGTGIVSLRVKGRAAKPAARTRSVSRWSQLADAVTSRAVAELTATPEPIPATVAAEQPPQSRPEAPFEEAHDLLETAWRASPGTVGNRSEETQERPGDLPEEGFQDGSERPGTRPEAAPKPAPRTRRSRIDPDLEPHMPTAERLAEEGLVRGLKARDYAQIIKALAAGKTANAIKSELSVGTGTVRKVAEALDDLDAEPPARRRLTTVG